MSRQSAANRQIADHLREMIRSGQAKEGDKLPSTQDLSTQWQVARSSIQAAMTVLVKEGLLERTPKRGTFVSKQSGKLTRVAIYLADNIWQRHTAAFDRALVSEFCNRLKNRGIVPELWIDSRPETEHYTAWPDLINAAEHRRFQAMMCVNGIGLNWIRHLPVPFVAMASFLSERNCVWFTDCSQIAAQELVRLGCRTMGVIDPYPDTQPDGNVLSRPKTIKAFCRAAVELGGQVRPEWIQNPVADLPAADSEHFGYIAMRRILALPQRPEGLFATHDLVARGAMIAVLESKIKVPQEMKLVLHRNLEVGFMCPVPVSFLDHSVVKVVDGLLEMLDSQLNGVELDPIGVAPTISVFGGYALPPENDG
ncbi:MAG: GntR family transcriptional regulator [Phycisphaerae bacterium]